MHKSLLSTKRPTQPWLTRKSVEASGTVIAEPMTLPQLDAFYKKEAATGAAIAKSINLQAQ
jgi:hypothetical protein